MKKIILLACISSVSLFNAQIKFEKGYFINNSGKKSEVLIKNLDWKNNPTEFEYKIEGSADIKRENIANIQEFGIGNESKYVRKKVMIDYSSEQLSDMSYERKPQFEEKTVFLKYIIDGKADLLYYENSEIQKFFFNINNSETKQLIYKSYYIDTNQIAHNEDYKKQLAEILNCGVENKKIDAAKYKTKDLANLFMSYNSCSDGNVAINYNQPAEKADLFNLNIRPGINSSSFEVTNSLYSPYSSAETTKFDRKTSFRIGIEAEFILPFNKNKWALFVEPTYQYYKTEKESIAYAGQYFETKSTREVDYKSIEVPFGVRYYFFLNNKSKIFLNAAYIMDLELNSKLKMDFTEIKIDSGSNLAFGVGYKYNDRFLVELRATTQRNLLQNYLYMTSKYQTISLILGYTLF